MKNGAPRFNLFIEREKFDKPMNCAPVSPGVCDMLGVRLSYAAADGGVRLTFDAAGEDRMINLIASGDPFRL
jgi:hypothetical protein